MARTSPPRTSPRHDRSAALARDLRGERVDNRDAERRVDALGELMTKHDQVQRFFDRGRSRGSPKNALRASNLFATQAVAHRNLGFFDALCALRGRHVFLAHGALLY